MRYIELNPLRAGMVDEPSERTHCIRHIADAMRIDHLGINGFF